MHCQRRGRSLNMVLPSGRVRDHHASLFHVFAAGLRMTPELEAMHARALLEARRRRILRDGFKASIEQLALSTQCREGKIS